MQLSQWFNLTIENRNFIVSLFDVFNPLSPNSDQQRFSPNNIHTLSRDKVLRINKMIIIGKIP